MADLYSAIGGNARKVAATGRLGTAPLAFVKVTSVAANGSTAVDYSAETAGSNLFDAVNALQGYAELYWVDGGTEGFIVAYNTATANLYDTDGTTAGWGKAEAAITAALALGGSSATTIATVDLSTTGVAID